jgi:predicted RNase H-like HicB family nuclease
MADDSLLIRLGIVSNRRRDLYMELTAVFREVREGYIAWVEELPGANSQGTTLDEARANLKEAVELVLDANRQIARQDGNDGDIREPLRTGRS